MPPANTPIRITVWNEFRHEKQSDQVEAIYPDGIHVTIAQFLEERLGAAVKVGTATLDEPEHGLTDDVLDNTDVLMWWGHAAHHEVCDDIVAKAQHHVLEGMGLVVLHSGHYSKLFRTLMGTDCGLKWREAAEIERIWCVNPGHPIADGMGQYIELPHTEMYGEHFDIPEPDELVFISWFEGGEVFRSGCCWRRGKGHIFYFRPGHETFPIYHNPQVQHVICNGVQYVTRKTGSPYAMGGSNIKQPLSPIAAEHAVDESLHQ